MRCPACDAEGYRSTSWWSTSWWFDDVTMWGCFKCRRRVLKVEDPALDGVPLDETLFTVFTEAGTAQMALVPWDYLRLTGPVIGQASPQKPDEWCCLAPTDGPWAGTLDDALEWLAGWDGEP